MEEAMKTREKNLSLYTMFNLWDTNQSGVNASSYPRMPADEYQPDTMGSLFFDTYFSLPRFAVETILAIMATILNLVTLVAMKNARSTRTKSVYNTLFINLAVADILACMLAWLCNNVLFLFNQQIWTMMFMTLNMCKVFVYLTAAVFVSSAFGIVSTITMLGFTTVQYLAICNPLHHQSILRKKKVWIFIGVSWAASLLAGIVPFVVLILITENKDCDETLLALILKVVLCGANTCVASVTVVFIIIVILCIKIFSEIRLIIKGHVVQHRHDRHVIKGEKKAFITIVILVVTLAIFVIPYTVIYMLSLNSQSQSGIQSQAVIYYMNLLPYLKFLSDPLIYGLRMREFKEGCIRIGGKCGFERCCRWNINQYIFSRGPSYSVRVVLTQQSSAS